MTTVDSESVTVQATVTVFDVYQPLVPAVPVMVLVMTGGVESAVPVPDMGRLGFVSFVLRSIVAFLAPADVGAKLAEKAVCPPAGTLISMPEVLRLNWVGLVRPRVGDPD